MQVKYSIFGTNNVVYFFFHMLCFLNKSSLVKNFYLSSVLPVDPVTYIMTNLPFLLKSTFIARHESRNFKLPWEIFGAFFNIQISRYSARANIKISHAGHENFIPGMPSMLSPTGFKIGMPGMPNRTSKNWEWNISTARDLGPKFS